MDEDFVFKVSLALLCLSSLLWIIVLLLIFWVGQIHQRVDSISKGWSVYCWLASCKDTPVTKENQPENPSSPLPLVIFNQQATDSDNGFSRKGINRAFAYASVRSEVIASGPSADETASMLPGEDGTIADAAKTQEQTAPVDPEVPVASYLQIIDHNPAIVAVASSENLAKDAKNEKSRIYISVSSVDEDIDNNMESPEDSTQMEHEKLRLNDKDDVTSSENANISSKNEPNAQQRRSKANDVSESEKASEADKPECVVFIEENRKQTASFSAVHKPNLISCQSDQQQNTQEFPEVKKNRSTARSEIVDGEKQPNRNDHVVSNAEKSFTSSKATEKEIPRHDSESKQVTPTEMPPKAKVRRKKKRSTTSHGMHSDKTNKAGGHTSPLKNVAEEKNRGLFTQNVVQLEKTERNGVPDLQQTRPRPGEQFQSGGVSNNEDQTENEYQAVNQVDQPAGTSLTANQTKSRLAESDEIKPEDGKHDKLISDYATTQEMTERNRTPSIVLQLRNLLQQKFDDSAQYVDREDKSTGGNQKAGQEDKGYENNAVNNCHAKTTDQLLGHPNISEEIYANVDDGNDDVYCEIPANVQPQVIYANQGNSRSVGDEQSHNNPIYVNIPVQRGMVTNNGDASHGNGHGFALYSNEIIDV